jgi:hypothetical protein
MDDLIAAHYKPVPQAAPVAVGGLGGLVVTDRRDSGRHLLAVQVKPGLPPRSRLLSGRVAAPVPHAVMPLDHGPGKDLAGKDGYFIICPALPGPAIAAEPRLWSESEVVRCLLLPAAAALDALSERGVSHRAIRPDNIFRAGPGERVVLGPCWAAPPASLQPAAFEPPYAAQCLPTGRGEGSPHDDVYALGVTILWCILGGSGDWADEGALLRRKLSDGSLAALAGQARLSPTLTDLLRGMLAEDPDHRPAPALLLDPEQARGRRLATRPAVRAQRPLEIGVTQAWVPRELAFALSANPDQGAALVRNGTVDSWLRRALGDTQMALRLDEAMSRTEQDPAEGGARQMHVPVHVTVSRAVAALDPLAPLVWRGWAVFPDGIGTALVTGVMAGQQAQTAALEEILTQDVTAAWLAGRVPRPEYTRMQQDVRDWRDWLGTRGVTGGLSRVLYGANPLLPCLSPLLAGRMVARLADLLPALEQAAAGADRKRPPIDAQIAAFVAARADPSILADAARLAGFASAADRLSVLGLFGRMQQRLHPEKLPALAGWLLESGMAELNDWRSVAMRKRLGELLAEQAAKGSIAPMTLLLQDTASLAQDGAGAQAAARRLADIEMALTALRSGAELRAARARQTGQEVATGLSLLSLLGGAVAVAWGL